MGCRTSSYGVVIQFCTREDEPDGAPVHGKHAHFLGRPRKEILAAQPPTRVEGGCLGSDDWLTVIAVSDDAATLDQIKADPELKEKGGPCQTSCCSRRATVILSFKGRDAEIYENCDTLASGPILEGEDFELIVLHIKVYRHGFNKRKLRRQWLGMTDYLQNR